MLRLNLIIAQICLHFAPLLLQLNGLQCLTRDEKDDNMQLLIQEAIISGLNYRLLVGDKTEIQGGRIFQTRFSPC